MPGNICPNTGMKDTQQVPCPGGSYQTLAGQTSCTTCPAGAYCPVGSAVPMLCPPGTYNDVTGSEFATECKVCPANYICAIYGLTTYSDSSQPSTQAGYLSPAGLKHQQELPCPPGTLDSTSSGTLTSPSSCTQCPAGFSCTAGTSTTGTPIPKQTCTPGYYCPAGSMHDKQYPCPGGTYSNSNSISSASQCNACPAGYFCPPGSYKTYICPAGYYCPSGTDNFQHYPCPGGKVSQKRGLTQASDCGTCEQGFFCQQYQSS